MLELRPNCELCDRDLPANSSQARICSYECTYCSDCVDNVLHNVCPTCGGNFVPRPIRPQITHKPELKLGLRNQPASDVRVHSKFDAEDIERFTSKLRYIAPNQR